MQTIGGFVDLYIRAKDAGVLLGGKSNELFDRFKARTLQLLFTYEAFLQQKEPNQALAVWTAKISMEMTALQQAQILSGSNWHQWSNRLVRACRMDQVAPQTKRST